MSKYISIAIIFLIGCCGYSTRPVLPSQYKTIAIPVVGNQTIRPGLGDLLTNQLIDDFTQDRSLRITRIDKADIVLDCNINNYERSPQSYTANQEVTTYKTSLNALVKVNDKTKPEAEPLFDGEISAWITYETATETEDDGINKAIAKLSQEIIRKVLTAW